MNLDLIFDFFYCRCKNFIFASGGNNMTACEQCGQLFLRGVDGKFFPVQVVGIITFGLKGDEYEN